MRGGLGLVVVCDGGLDLGPFRGVVVGLGLYGGLDQVLVMVAVWECS